MVFFVHGECRARVQLLVADLTFELLLQHNVVLDLAVALESVALSKRLRAVGAGKGFFASVAPQVESQRFGLRKAAIAKVALEGFLAGVQENVLLETSILGEAPIAVRTDKGPIAVVRNQVSHQIGPRGKVLIAFTARMLGRGVSMFAGRLFLGGRSLLLRHGCIQRLN